MVNVYCCCGFALGPVAFLPAGCVQSKSTKSSRDVGTETPEIMDLVTHTGSGTAHLRLVPLLLHDRTAAGTDALQKLCLRHQNKVQLRLYPKRGLRSFVPLDTLGPTILHTLV